MPNTTNPRILKLIAKSDKCWAIVMDTRAPMNERNAAHSRAMELDWETGRLLGEENRARRAAAR